MTNNPERTNQAKQLTLPTAFSEFSGQIESTFSSLNRFINTRPSTFETKIQIKQVLISRPRGGIAFSLLVGLPDSRSEDIEVALDPEVTIFSEEYIWQVISQAVAENEALQVKQINQPTEQVIFSQEDNKPLATD